MTDALSLAAVSKRFGGEPVLRGVSLRVQPRELLALLGSSGSGKTTFLRLIAGFEAPDEGEIRVAGRLVAAAPGSASANSAPEGAAPNRRAGNRVFIPAEERQVGYVPQDAALFPHLTVAENISFGLRQKGKQAREAAEQRIAELLQLVGMVGFESRLPHELSGGQRHRVALARALAPRPQLILLDEPFSALDAELRTRLRTEVSQILRATGTTAILVTHDQEEALSMADRVAVLRDGEIVQVDAPREIYQSPADVELATFLGDSVLIDGVVEAGKVLTALGSLTPQNRVTDGSRGLVAIRPENFYLQPDANGKGKVVSRQYFGHATIVQVALPGVTIRARANGPVAPEVGMRVTVWVRGTVNFYAG